jgi:DNA polymerase V
MIEIIGTKTDSKINVPLFSMSVAAGIPIPVEGEVKDYIDLNEFLITHPAATFFAKVMGNDFDFMGVKDNDIMIVDTSVEPNDGKMIIVEMNGELVLKIFRIFNDSEVLESANSSFIPINIEPFVKFNVIGVVTSIIHSF